MSAFQDVPLIWAGKTHMVPASRVMGALAVIEDAVSLDEMGMALDRRRIPLARLAMAYANVLRYLGVAVTDQAVYECMLGEPVREEMIQKLFALLEVMIKPALGLAARKVHNPGNLPKPVARLSRRRTKRRWVRVG